MRSDVISDSGTYATIILTIGLLGTLGLSITLLIILFSNVWIWICFLYSVYLMMYGYCLKDSITFVFFDDGLSINTPKMKEFINWKEVVRIDFKDIEDKDDVLTISIKKIQDGKQSHKIDKVKIKHEGRELYSKIKKELKGKNYSIVMRAR